MKESDIIPGATLYYRGAKVKVRDTFYLLPKEGYVDLIVLEGRTTTGWGGLNRRNFHTAISSVITEGELYSDYIKRKKLNKEAESLFK